ncbi:acetate kinase [Nocardioides sp. GY 10113]|uniref:acetate/propionate family kinase n=1 Tax=Nocardioides sp. GY 10113 TaxID=2569761 RepID=UPI0010A8F6C3|nr:acetate kinase [Nocardioides sp. GY 10113]TIC81529.1 acetate kinase [Nocardioides sp. GY 10113]
MAAPSLVLVLNAGSSTLKYQVLHPGSGDSLLRGVVERIGEDEVPDHGAALGVMQAALDDRGIGADALLAVGHRVVHGGPRLGQPTVIDDITLAEIEIQARLAPLHNPPAAAGIRSARHHFPDVPQVAVFDTGFFADLPAPAATYAIDAELAGREGIRRYGFHGISHEYVAAAVADFLDRPIGDLDQIVLHLGNGASASAIRGGRPVETSMGLTPLEGLVMGTRAGDLDPGVLLHLLRHGNLGVDALEDLLHHRSGLKGLSGHGDFRDLHVAIDDGDQGALAALQVYCHRVRKYVGAYLAVLGGADVITFTAGVGEHDDRVRADALADLEPLGIVLDPERNHAATTGPRRISADESPVAVLVIPTNEELSIARQAASLLAAS